MVSLEHATRTAKHQIHNMQIGCSGTCIVGTVERGGPGMPRTLRTALLVSFAMSFHVTADAEPVATPRPVTIDDFGKLKALGKPELSADGRQVAYALEGRIYIVPVRGGEPRQVTT